MITPEKIADIRTQAIIHGSDPDAAVEDYKTTLQNEQNVQKEASLKIWKKLGRAGNAEDFADLPS